MSLLNNSTPLSSQHPYNTCSHASNHPAYPPSLQAMTLSPATFLAWATGYGYHPLTADRCRFIENIALPTDAGIYAALFHARPSPFPAFAEIPVVPFPQLRYNPHIRHIIIHHPHSGHLRCLQCPFHIFPYKYQEAFFPMPFMLTCIRLKCPSTVTYTLPPFVFSFSIRQWIKCFLQGWSKWNIY